MNLFAPRDITVALHVDLDKIPELRREDFYCLGRLLKSPLVNGFTVRTGRSDSPGALLSNVFWISTMPGHWRHVTERRMVTLLAVVADV